MKPALNTILLFFFAAAVMYFSCKKEYSCESCRGANQPPIANAGNDTIITLPVDSILLDGSKSSDPDDGIASYAWIKISGPDTFNIANPSSPITIAKNLVKGTYQFELKVTDAGGLFSKDTIQITVNQPTLVSALRRNTSLSLIGQLPSAGMVRFSISV